MKRFLPSNVTPILDYLISIGKELLSGIIQLVRITAIACVCIIALFFIVLLILMLLGYKVNGNPTEIAKRAADHIRVSDCDRIIAYGVLPLGPTSEAIRGIVGINM